MTNDFTLLNTYNDSLEHNLRRLQGLYGLASLSQWRKVRKIFPELKDNLDQIMKDFTLRQDVAARIKKSLREGRLIYFEVDRLNRDGEFFDMIEIQANVVTYEANAVIFSQTLGDKDHFVHSIPIHRCGEVRTKTRVVEEDQSEDTDPPPYMARKVTDD